MNITRSAAWFLAALSAVPAYTLAAGSLDTALSRCAGISDDDSRLACYDAVAAMAADDDADSSSAAAEPSAKVPSESVASAAATEAVAAEVAMDSAAETSVSPVPDDFGAERVRGAEQAEEPVYGATVVRCEKHPRSGQIYFYFENGQVWKQTNYRQLYYDGCTFDVELSKDAFGYQIYIPEKDRTVRVSRLR